VWPALWYAQLQRSDLLERDVADDRVGKQSDDRARDDRRDDDQPVDLGATSQEAERVLRQHFATEVPTDARRDRHKQPVHWVPRVRAELHAEADEQPGANDDCEGKTAHHLLLSPRL